MSHGDRAKRQADQSKGWITSALLKLMAKKDYAMITVSSISDLAGVARQTFYRNYKSKDDVVVDFVDQIFREFVRQENERMPETRNDSTYRITAVRLN